MESKNGPPTKTRVFIVDDHPIVRLGLSQLVNQENDLAICGEATNAKEALAAIAVLQPDIAIVDISLPGTDGIELIKMLKIRYQALPLLILSMHSESLYGERALRAGASGYITKQEVNKKLVMAIQQVLRGEIYASNNMKTRLLKTFLHKSYDRTNSGVNCLSDREFETFRLFGEGLRTREIAELLYISVKTVETYRTHIKKKLDFKDSTELYQHAFHWVQSEDGPRPYDWTGRVRRV